MCTLFKTFFNLLWKYKSNLNGGNYNSKFPRGNQSPTQTSYIGTGLRDNGEFWKRKSRKRRNGRHGGHGGSWKKGGGGVQPPSREIKATVQWIAVSELLMSEGASCHNGRRRWTDTMSFATGIWRNCSTAKKL